MIWALLLLVVSRSPNGGSHVKSGQICAIFQKPVFNAGSLKAHPQAARRPTGAYNAYLVSWNGLLQMQQQHTAAVKVVNNRVISLGQYFDTFTRVPAL